MGFWEVRKLPIRAFQLMSINISRIMAERDLRSLECKVAAAVGGADAQTYRDRLLNDMQRGTATLGEDAPPPPEVLDTPLDSKGLSELRNWH